MSTFPLIKFAGIYYWQILEAIQQDRRNRVPSLNESNPLDPLIQLERSFALAGHFNCALIDLAGNECLLPTLQRRQSAQNVLRLLGQKLKGSTPSTAPLLVQLSTVLESDIADFIKTGHIFATTDEVSIPFEYLGENIDLVRTDRCIAWGDDPPGSPDDWSTEANSDVLLFVPWAVPEKNDLLYIGHNSIVFNQVDITFGTTPYTINGLWEYYDPSYRVHPDTVTKVGDTLKFVLDSIYGTTDKSGAVVRIADASTGNYEDVEVTWDGSNHIAITSWLVNDPSEAPEDYFTYPTWTPVEIIEDTLSGLTADGYIRFALPVDELRDWTKSDPLSLGYESFWLRFRVVSATGSGNHQFNRIKIFEGDQFVKLQVTQGETRVNEFTGTGAADQRYRLTRPSVIEGSVKVAVDTEYWEEVESLIESGPTSRSFTLEFVGDYTDILFGDGSLGYPPQLGSDIEGEYRTGADEDGNVGANSIVADQSGAAYVSKVYNPRAAVGWVPPEGSTEENLELLKLSAPKEFKAIDRIITAEDAATLAINFISSAGSSPIKRAKGMEERYGAKTLGAIVVGTAGELLDTVTLEELQEYLQSKALANHEVYAENFSPHSIDVHLKIAGGDLEIVAEYIRTFFDPLLIKVAGSYFWDFGTEISVAFISSLAFDADSSVVDVEVISPTANIDLAINALPVSGTILIEEL